MFEPFDHNVSETAADIDRAVHTLFDPLVQGELLSQDSCDKMCGEVIRFLLAIHAEGQRVNFLAQHLLDQLAIHPRRWDPVTPSTPDRRWGVVRINAEKGQRTHNLYNWLFLHRDYRISGSGDDKTFRLCPHLYNTVQDIDRAVRGMNAWYEGQPLLE